MNTLIVYATKHGTAEKCAKIMLEKISGEVDLYNLKYIKDIDISKYDKVIIGGSIYAGKIQKIVMEFCLKYIEELKKKKIGLFICCMNKKSEDIQLNSSFPQELLGVAEAKVNFGGEFRFKEMNFFEKLVVKMVSKSLAKEDNNSSTINSNEDISMLLEDNINRFVQIMNK